MATAKLSECFKVNILHLKVFGIWPGKIWNRYYKYYLVFFLCINLFTYNTLLILNLIFTPQKIELIIREVIFLFTEVAVIGKVFMILIMRKKLFVAFDILDCEAFKGSDEDSRQTVKRHVCKYKTYWKVFAILSNFAYSSQVFLPIFVHLVFKTNIELPICKYYFLDDEVVRHYFAFWFIYQSLGMYGHMQYNVNIDTLIAGLLLMAIAQVQVLKHELKNLGRTKMKSCNGINEDIIQINRLNTCLKHYEALLCYCTIVEDIIGVTMFVQFAMASIIICVVLCGLLLPASIESLLFMVSYLFAMILEIFVPAWLGTELRYEVSNHTLKEKLRLVVYLTYKSQELVAAAYSSEWIPRSERFKRSLKLFMERARTNIVIRGWIFPLSLDTFTSILKNAYSFFTLIKHVQDRQVD